MFVNLPSTTVICSDMSVLANNITVQSEMVCYAGIFLYKTLRDTCV